jgi:predicted amino acid-binding ACT domain protein
MVYVVISAVGKDRPGLIAAVSSTIASMDGNIEDMDSVVLKRDVFLLSMIVKIADDRMEKLRDALVEKGKEVGLNVMVYDGRDFGLRNHG